MCFWLRGIFSDFIDIIFVLGKEFILEFMGGFFLFFLGCRVFIFILGISLVFIIIVVIWNGSVGDSRFCVGSLRIFNLVLLVSAFFRIRWMGIFVRRFVR